jgi:hypothetical protein
MADANTPAHAWNTSRLLLVEARVSAGVYFLGRCRSGHLGARRGRRRQQRGLLLLAPRRRRSGAVISVEYAMPRC